MQLEEDEKIMYIKNELEEDSIIQNMSLNISIIGYLL